MGFRVGNIGKTGRGARKIRFIGCSADDDQVVPTQEFCFYSEAPTTPGTDLICEVDQSCSGTGYKQAFQCGIPSRTVGLTGIGDQVVPSGTATPIQFNRVDANSALMYDYTAANGV